MTAEGFLPDPFSLDSGARLFKTGDKARYRLDNNLEYLGRDDDQVKIRGYRIELSEIVKALEHHPSIREAVAIVREDPPGDKRIIAYVVPDIGRTITNAEMRHYLGATLPSYMVPSAMIILESLPVTPHGKIDRRRLVRQEEMNPSRERIAELVKELETLSDAEVLAILSEKRLSPEYL
jgi:acyl-coenzyme A synthetase/AMP-(fatty) acid ligase